MILHDVVVEGTRVDVRAEAGRIVEIADRLADRGADGIDGHGGALLPGLHDHHLHVWATAAHRDSVDCRAGLDALADAPGPRLRGVGFDGSVTRHELDAVERTRPVRVQHRGGALWMLNSAALAELGDLPDVPGVERDEEGPTGRLWGRDDLLRGTWPSVGDLVALGDELASYGLTGVTDATPGLEVAPPLRQRVHLLGPRKLHLEDHDLPTYDELHARVATLREAGAGVAVHCVTREALLLTLAVLDDVGRHPEDRIEHAAVVPEPAVLRGLRVVTQPGFVEAHGDRYEVEVESDDLPHLYRYASLLEAGVDVVPSSDAPYGPLDPWQVMRAAVERRLLPQERVTPATVLEGYLRDARLAPRRVAVGSPADLLLLHCSLEEALDALTCEVVRWVSPGPPTDAEPR